MNFQRIKALIVQHAFHLRRSVEDIIDAFFWPFMDIVVWGFLSIYFASFKGSAAAVASFILGGLILWNIVWRAQQDISIILMRNIWSRNLLNLFSTPLTISEFIVSSIIIGFLKILLTLSFVCLAAFFFYSFNIFSLGFYLLPFFFALIIFAWVAGLFITGLIIRYGMRIQAFAWSLIVLIQPASAVFYPVKILPSFLKDMALFLPTAHIFEGMREVLNFGSLSASHLIWAFGLDALYLAASVVFFARMFEKAKEKGKLAKSQM